MGEATQVSIDRGMDKQNVVYTLQTKCGIYTMKHYSDFKRKEVFAHATTWINLDDIITIIG